MMFILICATKSKAFIKGLLKQSQVVYCLSWKKGHMGKVVIKDIRDLS